LPRIEVPDVDAFMLVEVFDAARDAALRQVGRRSERSRSVWTQSACDKTGIFRSANPDGQVDPFLDKVAHHVADPQIDRYVRVAFTKQSQLWRQYMQRDRAGGRDLDVSRWLSPHGCGHLLDIFGLAQ